MRRGYLVVLPWLTGIVVAAACSTDAVGIQECRDIEEARCTAARSCDLGVDSDDDQAVCERFARDNCLHGLRSREIPKSSDLEACIGAIRKAGTCAATDAAKPASACDPALTTKGITVCDIIETPEQASACSFLLKDPPPEPTTTSTSSSDAAPD